MRCATTSTRSRTASSSSATRRSTCASSARTRRSVGSREPARRRWPSWPKATGRGPRASARRSRRRSRMRPRRRRPRRRRSSTGPPPGSASTARPSGSTPTCSPAAAATPSTRATSSASRCSCCRSPRSSRPARSPWSCVYLDYEMTLEDVLERLDDMGYRGADLSRLRYALLPDLPPLDAAAGGAALMAMLDGVRAAWPGHHLVLVIDTISRAVAGDENSADTYRAFYAHTGIELKRREVTWVRLDHAGKDDGAGQRGSSAKGDDIDLAWRLERSKGRLALRRDLSRMPWVPERVDLPPPRGAAALHAPRRRLPRGHGRARGDPRPPRGTAGGDGARGAGVLAHDRQGTPRRAHPGGHAPAPREGAGGP